MERVLAVLSVLDLEDFSKDSRVYPSVAASKPTTDIVMDKFQTNWSVHLGPCRYLTASQKDERLSRMQMKLKSSRRQLTQLKDSTAKGNREARLDCD